MGGGLSPSFVSSIVNSFIILTPPLVCENKDQTCITLWPLWHYVYVRGSEVFERHWQGTNCDGLTAALIGCFRDALVNQHLSKNGPRKAHWQTGDKVIGNQGSLMHKLAAKGDKYNMVIMLCLICVPVVQKKVWDCCFIKISFKCLDSFNCSFILFPCPVC